MAKPRKPPAHGGAREGAGRPPLDDEERTIQISISLTPDQLEWLDWEADRKGESRSEIVRRLIDRAN